MHELTSLLFTDVQFYPLRSFNTLILLSPVYQDIPYGRQGFLGN